MRRLVLAVVLLGTVPFLGSCSLFRRSDGLDLVADCEARMQDADPSETIDRMEADVHATTFRSDVYVTGTVARRGGTATDHFHCAYNGDALLSSDRKPPPARIAPDSAAPDAAAPDAGSAAPAPGASGPAMP